jgi:hypothetical protein
MESLKSVCSLIFYIVLNNYILFYQQVIWFIINRL